MSDFFSHTYPLLVRVKEIEESLYIYSITEQEGEILQYGTYEKEFEKYRLDKLRNENINITKKDYFKHLLDEIKKIENLFILKEKEGIVQSDRLLKNAYNCKKLIEDRIKLLKTPLTIENIKSNSFNWEIICEREIERFYSDLINGGFIDKEVDYTVFRGIFSNPIIKPDKPILWLKEIQDLVYLFKKLSEEKIISKNHIHSIIEVYQLFKTKKNNYLTRKNLDPAKSNLNKIEPPISRNGKNISKIISVINLIREQKT